MLVPFVNSYQVQIIVYKSHNFFSLIGVTMFIHTRADGLNGSIDETLSIIGNILTYDC